MKMKFLKILLVGIAALLSAVSVPVLFAGCNHDGALPVLNAPDMADTSVCPEPTVVLAPDTLTSLAVATTAKSQLMMKAHFAGPEEPRCAVSITGLKFAVKGSSQSNGVYWEQDSGGGSQSASGLISNNMIEAGPGHLKYLGNGKSDMYLQFVSDPNGAQTAFNLNAQPGHIFGVDLIAVDYVVTATGEKHTKQMGLPLEGNLFIFVSWPTCRSTIYDPPGGNDLPQGKLLLGIYREGYGPMPSCNELDWFNVTWPKGFSPDLVAVSHNMQIMMIELEPSGDGSRNYQLYAGPYGDLELVLVNWKDVPPGEKITARADGFEVTTTF